MLKIAICIKEEQIHDSLKNMILLYSKDNRINIEISNYACIDQFLRKKKEIDLLFLDNEMPEINQKNIPLQLSDWGTNFRIIMLKEQEQFNNPQNIDVFRFLSIPIRKMEFYKAIDDVCGHLVGLETVKVFRDGMPYQIIQKDILYVESGLTTSLIYVGGVEYRSKLPLTMWLNILDDRMFFQSHRHYIVNLSKIDEIEENVVRLVNGEKVAVSKKYRMSLLHAFMVYDTSRR